ncbi:MAG TPA: SAM-dependent methyltransferase [Dongiaceae bacterium]|nr:SAM-dependent methyltransferase [Dongiaceae bacterium]
MDGRADHDHDGVGAGGVHTPGTSTMELIKRRIAETGPLPVASFMRLALSEPGIGYYATRDPLGAAGDFVTAPEISQMFGEMIGLWCVDLWEKFGKPDLFLLVELGPGRGTLMADALRAARVRPEFLRAMRLHLVEISRPLRVKQAQRLGAFAPAWHDEVADVPDGLMILLGNEFLDALPIHQFQMTDKGWRERAVGLMDGELAWTHDAPGPELDLLRPAHRKAKPGDIAEICPAALSLAEALAGRFARDGGVALFLDYGPTRSGLGDSFQALRGHRPADPLREAGQADLTAHVDFAALADKARAGGANAFGPIGQGPFLQALGIEQRASMLAAKANEADRAAIAASLHRLIAPAQMGSLFKALAIAAPQVTELAGFS